MNRERAVKILLLLVGLTFSAAVYPLMMSLREPQAELLQMFLGVYITLGIFVLLAARNPSANRSLVAFTAWSSLVHAAIMAVQAFYTASERGHLLGGAALFGVIGVALVVLAPARQSGERASAAVA